MLKSEPISSRDSAAAPGELFDNPAPRAQGTGEQPVIVEPAEVLASDRGDLDPIGKSEDLHRAVDGVPHQVVGFTALFSFVFAVLLVLLFISGFAGRVSAVLLAVIGLPVLIMSLAGRAERTRDHDHPSR